VPTVYNRTVARQSRSLERDLVLARERVMRPRRKVMSLLRGPTPYPGANDTINSRFLRHELILGKLSSSAGPLTPSHRRPSPRACPPDRNHSLRPRGRGPYRNIAAHLAALFSQPCRSYPEIVLISWSRGHDPSYTVAISS
jgi:hypothetical protein